MTSSFWISFLVGQALAAAQAFILSSGLKPAVKIALVKFIAAGQSLVTALQSSGAKLVAAFDSPFNPAQLSTWAEASHWAALLSNSAQFKAAGISIKPQSPPNSGVYIPIWTAGPGSQEPQIGNSFWIHYRWSNGMEGMNAGLVRQKFLAFPTSPLYVIGQLLLEVQAGAK